MFEPRIKDALKKLRDEFRSGSIKKIENPKGIFDKGISLDPVGFNMLYASITTKCGTVCCIMGYLEQRMGEDPIEIQPTGKGFDILSELFFPNDAPRDVFLAGPKDAAAAIQNALEGKTTPWRGVYITGE